MTMDSVLAKTQCAGASATVGIAVRTVIVIILTNDFLEINA